MAINHGIKLIRSHPGLQSHIARALGITRGAVAKWSRVPAERVLAVEAVSGIPRTDLRPDIFPPVWRNALRKPVSTKTQHRSRKNPITTPTVPL